MQRGMPHCRSSQPGMSGLELQARLKTERCRIPIIFITARGDIPLSVSAMKEGAIFFTKPVDAVALLSSIVKGNGAGSC
jgi:FixJ family two-component response regulator